MGFAFPGFTSGSKNPRPLSPRCHPAGWPVTSALLCGGALSRLGDRGSQEPVSSMWSQVQDAWTPWWSQGPDVPCLVVPMGVASALFSVSTLTAGRLLPGGVPRGPGRWTRCTNCQSQPSRYWLSNTCQPQPLGHLLNHQPRLKTQVAHVFTADWFSQAPKGRVNSLTTDPQGGDASPGLSRPHGRRGTCQLPSLSASAPPSVAGTVCPVPPSPGELGGLKPSSEGRSLSCHHLASGIK